MLRPALLTTAALLLIADSAQAAGHFRNLMPYTDARALFLRLGYTPFFMPGADVCDPNDPRCYPEYEYCARNRTLTCTYAWRRGKSIIEVDTEFEVAVVTRAECIVNCTRQGAKPVRTVSARPAD